MQVLMSSSGLGGLSVNTIVLPFHEVDGLTTRHSRVELHAMGSPASYEGLEKRLAGESDDDSQPLQ